MFGTDVRNRQCSEQCSEPTKEHTVANPRRGLAQTRRHLGEAVEDLVDVHPKQAVDLRLRLLETPFVLTAEDRAAADKHSHGSL